ncbi:MAG: RluA family pseudouridine synthase [Planctomycetota bacterium]
MRLDLFLTQACDGLSRTQVRDAVQNDGCVVDGRLKRPSLKLKPGMVIQFDVPPPTPDDTIPENIPLDILYEDDGLVVVNKPAGMVVHPARGNWSGTLTSALAFRFQSLSDVGGPTRPGIVHRLDRDTSGVIVVAKNNASHLNLAQQWADRTVTKTYLAITAGRLDRDRDWIHAPIGRHPYQREKQAIREGHESSKPASTFYEALHRFGRLTQVRVTPKTGRTHQIRVHLAHVGCPILCDRLYGGQASLTRDDLQRAIGKSIQDQTKIDEDVIASKRSIQNNADEILLQRQALHAHQLQFTNPSTGKPMTVTAPLPPDMRGVMDLLQ